MEISSTEKMQKRETLSQEFYKAILDPEDHPWLVTDEACIYDFTFESDEILIEKINIYYGVGVTVNQLKEPFWKLLDFLDKNRLKTF